MLKTLTIKISAFFVRTFTLIMGILDIIAYLTALYNLQIAIALPGLIAGLILIFPFRLIKSFRYLEIYFYLLLSTTVSLVVCQWIFTDYSSPSSKLFSFIISLILIFNSYFIYLYLLHRHDTDLINPLTEKKDLKFWSIPFITAIIIILYLIIDFRTTTSGKQYIEIPTVIPYVAANFDPKAFYRGYQIESGIYEHNRPIFVRIKKQSLEKKYFIEIFENGQKIYRADYEQENIKNISTFDKDGTEHKSITFKIYGRDKQGIFREIPETEQYTALSRIDLEISTDRFGIQIYKTINYPQKPKYIPLPFLRSKQDWKLTMKDSNGEIPLVNDLHIWY